MRSPRQHKKLCKKAAKIIARDNPNIGFQLEHDYDAQITSGGECLCLGITEVGYEGEAYWQDAFSVLFDYVFYSSGRSIVKTAGVFRYAAINEIKISRLFHG